MQDGMLNLQCVAMHGSITLWWGGHLLPLTPLPQFQFLWRALSMAMLQYEQVRVFTTRQYHNAHSTAQDDERNMIWEMSSFTSFWMDV